MPAHPRGGGGGRRFIVSPFIHQAQQSKENGIGSKSGLKYTNDIVIRSRGGWRVDPQPSPGPRAPGGPTPAFLASPSRSREQYHFFLGGAPRGRQPRRSSEAAQSKTPTARMPFKPCARLEGSGAECPQAVDVETGAAKRTPQETQTCRYFLSPRHSDCMPIVYLIHLFSLIFLLQSTIECEPPATQEEEQTAFRVG